MRVCVHACVCVMCTLLGFCRDRDLLSPPLAPCPLLQVQGLGQLQQRGANLEGGSSAPWILPQIHPPLNCSVTQETLISLPESRPLDSDGGIIMVTLQCFEAW